jgi:TonB family protein
MFDTTLIASNPRREVRRKLATLPAALAVHVVALGAVAVGQLWAVSPVLDPAVFVAFVDGPPPSPPPAKPKPLRGDGAAVKPTPRPELVQPRVIPVESATAGPPDQTGPEGGVDGSDDGKGNVAAVGDLTSKHDPEPTPVVADDAPVRPGAGIVLPVNVYRRDPVYPELARKAGLQGVVIVEATIDRQGNVIEANVLRDPGLGCGAAVVEALRSWKYRPATRNGRPVSIIVTVTVTFRLAGGV